MRLFASLAVAAALVAAKAECQSTADVGNLVSIKSGETAEMGRVTWTTANCADYYQAFEGIDLMEGPKTLTLRFEPGKVPLTRKNCAKTVTGGTVFATAGYVSERMDAILTYRARIKTREGPRQITRRYRVLLFPASDPGRN